MGSMEATVPLIWELDLELLTVWTMTMTHQILQIPPGEITFEFFQFSRFIFPEFFNIFYFPEVKIMTRIAEDLPEVVSRPLFPVII